MGWVHILILWGRGATSMTGWHLETMSFSSTAAYTQRSNVLVAPVTLVRNHTRFTTPFLGYSRRAVQP
jgi:hypothetical protein